MQYTVLNEYIPINHAILKGSEYRMTEKLKVGIVGGTGMVGQRFVQLLDQHPWFKLTTIAASASSAGKTYEESVQGRWKMLDPIPEEVKKLVVHDASKVEEVADQVDFIFCAVDMKKNEIRALEEAYAKTGTPVVSNNSAHRWTPDIPMVIPEINPEHIEVISTQRKRLGTSTGFIAVKPNCSIQSYVPMLHALLDYKPTKVVASTYEAISGAGKNFTNWPDMLDNVIPFISGEEEKSEQEPLRIWGSLVNGEIIKASSPLITSQCIRVPVTDGHLAAVFVSFEHKPSKEEILDRWLQFKGRPQELGLPSAPKQFITYFEEENRPQTKLDRDIERGMGVSAGRLREDSIYDFKFVGLSHNTLRGAAGGSVLIAELLKAEGYIQAK
jgi:aspartate-semialdehyde dehydrogenase